MFNKGRISPRIFSEMEYKRKRWPGLELWSVGLWVWMESRATGNSGPGKWWKSSIACWGEGQSHVYCSEIHSSSLFKKIDWNKLLLTLPDTMAKGGHGYQNRPAHEFNPASCHGAAAEPSWDQARMGTCLPYKTSLWTGPRGGRLLSHWAGRSEKPEKGDREKTWKWPWRPKRQNTQKLTLKKPANNINILENRVRWSEKNNQETQYPQRWLNI